MSFNFVLCFLFFFSNLPLLLSATPECKREKTPCGYLGEISFPFTTVKDSECGYYYISGCDNSSLVKTINLINQAYEIESISYTLNSVIIYGLNFSEADLTKDTPIVKFNIITFHGCHHDIRNENMILYRSCSDYDIYFTSTPDKPPLFPMSQIPCLQAVKDLVRFTPYDCAAELLSLLEIKVEVDFESCEQCNFDGSSCLLNQENFNLSCGPAPTPQIPKQIPKRNDRYLKNAVIGLSIGLATMTAIALFLIILVLYYWRIKS